MLDIKGEVVSQDDKVLLSTNQGFKLTTLKKETKLSWVLGDGTRVNKFNKIWVGSKYVCSNDTTKDWDWSMPTSLRIILNLGDNNTRWKYIDLTAIKQKRVLKVPNDYEI